MKKILSIVFCLGIVFSSILAFSIESESPPDVEKVELSDALTVNSEFVVTEFAVESPSVCEEPSEMELIFSAYFSTNDSVDNYNVQLIENDANEPGEKPNANTGNEELGRDVYVSNIGYTLEDGCSTNSFIVEKMEVEVPDIFYSSLI